MRTHPHAEATYSVIPLNGGGYGVLVSVPGAEPATVSRFEDEAAAEAWIEGHKLRVQAHGAGPGRRP